MSNVTFTPEEIAGLIPFYSLEQLNCIFQSPFVNRKVRVGAILPGEYFIGADGEAHVWDGATSSLGNYIILSPPKKITRKRVIFEQSEDEPRCLNVGEFGMDPDDTPSWRGVGYGMEETSISRYFIYTRREETFEVEIEETAGCC